MNGDLPRKRLPVSGGLQKFSLHVCGRGLGMLPSNGGFF